MHSTVLINLNYLLKCTVELLQFKNKFSNGTHTIVLQSANNFALIDKNWVKELIPLRKSYLIFPDWNCNKNDRKDVDD